MGQHIAYNIRAYLLNLVGTAIFMDKECHLYGRHLPTILRGL